MDVAHRQMFGTCGLVVCECITIKDCIVKMAAGIKEHPDAASCREWEGFTSMGEDLADILTREKVWRTLFSSLSAVQKTERAPIEALATSKSTFLQGVVVLAENTRKAKETRPTSPNDKDRQDRLKWAKSLILTCQTPKAPTRWQKYRHPLLKTYTY